MNYVELNNQLYIKETGEVNFEKDKEALKDYFINNINVKKRTFRTFKEKINYLMNEGYYNKVLFDWYTLDEMKEVFDRAYSYDFRFPTFGSAFSFYDKYAMRSWDKKTFLELYEDRVSITCLFLARGDINKALDFTDRLMKQRYQPATPTVMNAGRAAGGEMVSCFLLDINDSMNDISFASRNAKELSKIGGGVSLNLTPLRGRGEPIRGVENSTSGVVPVMKILEADFNYANQQGVRDGSGVAWLNIFHSDSPEFLSTKKINTDEEVRLKTLSLGISIPDKFLELAEEDKDFYMFYPHTVKQEYGLDIDEIDWDKMYEEIVANPKVRKKKMSARNMFDDVMRVLFESGYPYVMFEGNVNNDHPLKYLGRVKKSNLCTEILQYSEKSIIKDYFEEDEIGMDISCNLGSLNVVNVMEGKDLKGDVFAAMEMATAVSEMSAINNVPSIAKANELMHSIGIGYMNLHGYLAKNKVLYGSKQSIEFVRAFASTINYWSIMKSMEMAKEKGKTFYGFEKSTYADGTYFDMYLNEDFTPKSKKVKSLFEGIELPTKEDWKRLKELVMKYGLYHAYRLATAPTGSISYIHNATAGAMPIVDKFETRLKKDHKIIIPMPYIEDKEVEMYYQSGYDIDQFKVIDLIAELQRHVDQGISFTIHFKGEPQTNVLGRYYVYAWKRGIKTLYYVKTKLTQVTECESCMV